MAKDYDVIVAGGGHNGLTAAAYLAKAGLNVCVVETHEYVGGGAITREVNGPGFKHDLASTCHSFAFFNPLYTNDELKLRSKYGYQCLQTEILTSVIFPDERALVMTRDIDKTCASIAKFSPKDAEAYRRMHDWVMSFIDMFIGGMLSPAPPFGAFPLKVTVPVELLPPTKLEGLKERDDKVGAATLRAEDLLAPP